MALPMWTPTHTDRHPDGRVIRVNEAQIGDTVSEILRDGSARFGVVTAVHGGVTYRADDGREYSVSHKRMGGVDRPI